MNKQMTGTRMGLSQHERFWLDVIRTASNDTDPVPTLERTQRLRRLFSGDVEIATRPESLDVR